MIFYSPKNFFEEFSRFYLALLLQSKRDQFEVAWIEERIFAPPLVPWELPFYCRRGRREAKSEIGVKQIKSPLSLLSSFLGCTVPTRRG